MNEEQKPVPISNVPALSAELEVLRKIEQHLNVIRQIIVFLVIISAVVGVMQLCAMLAGMLGIQLY